MMGDLGWQICPANGGWLFRPAILMSKLQPQLSNEKYNFEIRFGCFSFILRQNNDGGWFLLGTWEILFCHIMNNLYFCKK